VVYRISITVAHPPLSSPTLVHLQHLTEDNELANAGQNGKLPKPALNVMILLISIAKSEERSIKYYILGNITRTRTFAQMTNGAISVFWCFTTKSTLEPTLKYHMLYFLNVIFFRFHAFMSNIECSLLLVA
jgi:hypothetical protein